ncbi:MAG: ABC transporter permease [Bacteroidota bacterium]|nr:ABC transporter permease [Bacteroidota bacterium]
MTNIKDIYSILLREISLIVHDKNIVMMIFIAPIFYAFFYGSIYINKTESDVAIAVVDMDHSTTAARLIRNLDGHQLIKVNYITSNLADAKKELSNLNVSGIVYIDKDFEKNLKKGVGTTLKVYLNTTRFLVSNDLNRGINEVVLSMGDQIKANFFRSAGYNAEQATELAQPLNVDMRPMFNTSETYGDFLIPGIIVLILQQTLLIGIGEAVAKERENKSLINLFKISDNNIVSTLFGKTIFYYILYCIYALFFFSVHFYIFKIHISGNILELVTITSLFLLAVTFLGVFISSFFKRKILALQVLAFTSYPFFFLSGFSWPLHSLPASFQWLAYLIPTTPFLQAFTRVAQMGATFHHLHGEIINMLVLVAIFFTLSLIRLKVLVKEEME